MTDPKTGSERIWDIAAKFSVPVVLALCAALVSHEVRISRVEATNAATILVSIDTRLRGIERAVTRLETLHEQGK